MNSARFERPQSAKPRCKATGWSPLFELPVFSAMCKRNAKSELGLGSDLSNYRPSVRRYGLISAMNQAFTRLLKRVKTESSSLVIRPHSWRGRSTTSSSIQGSLKFHTPKGERYVEPSASPKNLEAYSIAPDQGLFSSFTFPRRPNVSICAIFSSRCGGARTFLRRSVVPIHGPCRLSYIGSDSGSAQVVRRVSIQAIQTATHLDELRRPSGSLARLLIS